MVYSNLQRLLHCLSEHGYDPHRDIASSVERLGQAVLRENDLSEIPWDGDLVFLLGYVAHDMGDLSTLAKIVTVGLQHDSVVVRDAAVSLCELDDDALLPILRTHREPVEWLRECIRVVLAQSASSCT